MVRVTAPRGKPQKKVMVSGSYPKTHQPCKWKIVPERGGSWRCVDEAPG